ncbi:MAG: DUF1361 domain-containing protein [Micrococcales bacterium]|nr:DUF1361 domain-containing protein [Micrococcales bacterium]
MGFLLDRRIVVLVVACVVEAAGCWGVFVVTGRPVFWFFVWNLFLAVLPALVSLVVDRLGPSRPWVGWVGCLVWLPLFPNTVYVVTDVVHITRVEFFAHRRGWCTEEGWPFHCYAGDETVWAQLIVLMGLVVLTLWIGLWSLAHVHTFLASRWGRTAGWCAVVVVAGAAGYGVYLGRFVRLNSWEVLNPTVLVPQVVDATNQFAAVFTVMFGVYVLVAYLLFWAFTTAPARDGRTSARASNT